MIGGHKKQRTRWGLRRWALVTGGAVLVAGTCWFCRSSILPGARAQQTAGAKSESAAPAPDATPSTSDYTKRVVAYLNGHEPVTRQDLGEYLIARYGAERLPALLNRRIVEHACRQRGLEVTSAEVDAALAQNLETLKVDEKTFVRTVLARYHKTLYEWKEDVIRPRLMMTKLVKGRVHHTEEDLRRAYESVYGEKIECRMILWPKDKEGEVRANYSNLANSEEAFAQAAKTQKTSELASSGGKLKPFGRWTLDPKLDEVAFKLHPGEVSVLLNVPQGCCIIKCDRRISPDTTVSIESVRPKLVEQIVEVKTQAEIRKTFEDLSKQFQPNPLLKKTDRVPEGAKVPSPEQVVGYYNTNVPVTREELGEYLIARYGADRLELLVNHLIIDEACKERKITVTTAEIEAAFAQDLKTMKVSRDVFEKDVLGKWGKNLFEWREDVIRPRLMMTKLCQSRVHCTDEDLHKAFEAYHGEKLQCRIILWPADQFKFALAEYPTIRDSEAEFAKRAKQQASPSLAATGGVIPAFGHHSLGNEELEQAAFSLHPGEVSTVVQTPQGHVVVKLDKRIPPETSVKLEQEREKLTKEVLEKKVQQEMQVVFKELKDRARPRLMLKDPSKPEDLVAQTRQLMADLPPIQAPRPGTMPRVGSQGPR
jgi:parvulin-like peptidyl-prolyl isomerase